MNATSWVRLRNDGRAPILTDVSGLQHLLFEWVLSDSRWTYVSLVLSETFKALVAGLEGALWTLGAVPAVLRHGQPVGVDARAEAESPAAVDGAVRAGAGPPRAAADVEYVRLPHLAAATTGERRGGNASRPARRRRSPRLRPCAGPSALARPAQSRTRPAAAPKTIRTGQNACRTAARVVRQGSPDSRNSCRAPETARPGSGLSGHTALPGPDTGSSLRPRTSTRVGTAVPGAMDVDAVPPLEHGNSQARSMGRRTGSDDQHDRRDCQGGREVRQVTAPHTARTLPFCTSLFVDLLRSRPEPYSNHARPVATQTGRGTTSSAASSDVDSVINVKPTAAPGSRTPRGRGRRRWPPRRAAAGRPRYKSRPRGPSRTPLYLPRDSRS